MYDRRVARDRIPPGAIVETAITLIDRQGFEALSLSTVAAVIGVRPSALYGHVGNLDETATASPWSRPITSPARSVQRRWVSPRPDALDAIRPRLPRIRRPPRPVLGDPAPGHEQRPPRRRRPGCATSSQGCTGASASTPTPPTSPLATPAARSMASFRSSMRPGRLPDARRPPQPSAPAAPPWSRPDPAVSSWLWSARCGSRCSASSWRP